MSSPTDPRSTDPAPSHASAAADAGRRPAPRRLLVAAGGLALVAGAGLALWREGVSAGSDAAAPSAPGAAPGNTSSPTDAGGSDPAMALQAFWALQLPRPDGSLMAMSSLQGAPLLINFWATWCPPCVRELPALDRMHRDREGRPGTVLGLAIDSPDPVREFLQRSPVGFPVVLAGFDGTQWGRRFGNAQGGLPFSVLFGAEGQILERHIGELDERRLTAWSARMDA